VTFFNGEYTNIQIHYVTVVFRKISILNIIYTIILMSNKAVSIDIGSIDKIPMLAVSARDQGFTLISVNL